MIRTIALLSTLVLCACEPYVSPAPNIISIEPEEVMSGEAATVAVKLDGPLPVKVDYGKQTATLVTPTLLIGGQAAPITHVEQDGTLLATLPGSLSAGLQDVRLELANGSGSVSEQGLTVLPLPPELDEDGGPGDPGTDPGTGNGGGDQELRVTGVLIEPIPDQVRDVPFTITLRVEGPDAALFEGQVQLSTNKGRISPNLSNSFSKGVRQEQVILDKQGGNMVLTVRVGSTLVAKSNSFKVSPK
ncbi:hypothetical protein KYC5002_38580 [Archangium violaceum]|uniref:hypothetical protein n=1 Tax=Archangium violaceum TaxID=83451 RepID=UPI002B2CE269|nr:hypothetical protein KYC5002_38580 [Archangium gephyra]